MIKLLEAELHDVKGIKRASFSFPFKTRLEEFKENANLLGFYGPNGYGKSGLIKSFSLLKSWALSQKLEDYVSLIDVEASKSEIVLDYLVEEETTKFFKVLFSFSKEQEVKILYKEMSARKFIEVTGKEDFPFLKYWQELDFFPSFIDEKKPYEEFLENGIYQGSKSLLEEFQKGVAELNYLFPLLSEGYRFDLKVEERKEQALFKLFISKDGRIFPLEGESHGLKKLRLLLANLTRLFRDSSSFLMIDEMDEGLFEYLFGALIQLIAERGRGQLIFTAHNLRPLEILSARSFYFSTSDPNNRFQHFSLGKNKNLRDAYLRYLHLEDPLKINLLPARLYEEE